MSTYETFFYMEGDTVPTQPMWLDALRADADAKAPFAVLGSRYKGHNWDNYVNASSPEAEAVIPLSLQLHLNGNAVYVEPHLRHHHCHCSSLNQHNTIITTTSTAVTTATSAITSTTIIHTRAHTRAPALTHLIPSTTNDNSSTRHFQHE